MPRETASAGRLNSRSELVLARHHWVHDILNAGHRPGRKGSSDELQRPRVRDEGEPPSWRTLAVV